MAEKIAKLGIKRDENFLYYLKGGDVWAAPKRKPGQPRGEAFMVVAVGLEIDLSQYSYEIDDDGDITRSPRAVRGDAASAERDLDE
jgi:hypothetical protein